MHYFIQECFLLTFKLATSLTSTSSLKTFSTGTLSSEAGDLISGKGLLKLPGCFRFGASSSDSASDAEETTRRISN